MAKVSNNKELRGNRLITLFFTLVGVFAIALTTTIIIDKKNRDYSYSVSVSESNRIDNENKAKANKINTILIDYVNSKIPAEDAQEQILALEYASIYKRLTFTTRNSNNCFYSFDISVNVANKPYGDLNSVFEDMVLEKNPLLLSSFTETTPVKIVPLESVAAKTKMSSIVVDSLISFCPTENLENNKLQYVIEDKLNPESHKISLSVLTNSGIRSTSYVDYKPNPGPGQYKLQPALIKEITKGANPIAYFLLLKLFEN